MYIVTIIHLLLAHLLGLCASSPLSTSSNDESTNSTLSSLNECVLLLSFYFHVPNSLMTFELMTELEC